jgi:hypothetical protein
VITIEFVMGTGTYVEDVQCIRVSARDAQLLHCRALRQFSAFAACSAPIVVPVRKTRKKLRPAILNACIKLINLK